MMLNETSLISEAVLDRQRQLWLDGQSPDVLDLLREQGLENDSEALLDLLYHEVVLREELGFEPMLEDYLTRFPELSDDLHLHFEVHRVVSEQSLLDTATSRAVKSWPLSVRSMLLNDVPPHDYDIQGVVGQGGMAVVYQARHHRLHRDVALKMFRTSHGLTRREVARIRTEAEAMARLSHPHIMPIYEIGEHHGIPFLALEYASGGTLADRLQVSPLTAEAAVDLIETLAAAVQHAHDRGIIHRDLKPANVLFTEAGTPKLTDFGLAKILEERTLSSADMTQTGEAIGTPRYMAPEQASGQHDRVGPATDVYALGTMLYECLTGRAPFVSANVPETLQQICHTDPIPLRKLQPSTPRDLETICLHCLEKDPQRRYASAILLLEDLRRYRNATPILVRPTSRRERIWKWCRRKPAHAALTLLISALAIGGLFAAVVIKQRHANHVAALRREVALLVQSGRLALERDELEAAQSRFHEAWLIVQSEPALSDHETSVTGWLDHSRNALNRYHWNQRVPPRDFDDRRDEALLLAVLPFSNTPDSMELALAAIHEALELTLPREAAWLLEREQLILQEAALIARQTGANAAVTFLASTSEFDSRQFHLAKAEYLDASNRRDEAVQEKAAAEKFPLRTVSSKFQTAMTKLRDQNFESGLQDFDAVQLSEPEHFAARLLLSLCLLRLDRPAEAKIALTACIAQRPRFAWSYLFRGQAHAALGDKELANRDWLVIKEGRPSNALLQILNWELRTVPTNVHGISDSDSDSASRASRLPSPN